MNFKLILVLVIAGLVVAFIAQNAAVAQIRFLFWQAEMSRALLLFLVMAVGILTGWLMHAYFLHGKKK